MFFFKILLRTQICLSLFVVFFRADFSDTYEINRQKEKKDVGASYSASSGSAPDSDDIELQSTGSTSPSSAHSHHSSSTSLARGISTAFPSYSNFDTLPFLPPSHILYASAPPINNNSTTDPKSRPLRATVPTLLPALPLDHFESKLEEPVIFSEVGAVHPTSGRSSYVHRPSNTSVITAKKHVKKRPLGSHAPLARAPSLPHNFDFPPSPPRGLTALPTKLRATGSTMASKDGNVLGRVEENAVLNDRSFPKRSSASALMTNESGRASLGVENVISSTPSKKRKSKDEVWQHMESDPPSAQSPINGHHRLTRTRMLALAAAETEAGDDGSSHLDHISSLSLTADAASTTTSLKAFPSRPTIGPSLPSLSSSMLPTLSGLVASTSTTRRPSIARSLSLGGVPTSTIEHTSSSASLTAMVERSRAGGEDACAELALERKRARMEPTSHAPSSITSSNGRVKKRISTKSTGEPRQPRPKTRRASSLTSSNGSDASFSSMAELSFSSTVTASSAATSVGKQDPSSGDFFSLSGPAKSGESYARRGGVVDVERECAELLLGLGGFF